MEYVLLSLIVLAGTVGTGVFFLKRELPARRAVKEKWRAQRLKQAREAWDRHRAIQEQRRAQAEQRAQNERERLAQLARQREEKEARAALASVKIAEREEVIRGREKRKETRADKMRRWQERRHQHIAGKNKSNEPN